MYLLMVYSLMVILGGAATGNVYSAVGAAREFDSAPKPSDACAVVSPPHLGEWRHDVRHPGLVERFRACTVPDSLSRKNGERGKLQRG
jgi:hypothetical protein